MIFIKNNLEYEVKKFTIYYYEILSINDFSFLTILLANKAIEEKIDLSKLFKDFTKGDNDYYLLLCKRFEKLFQVEIKNFLEIKDKIIISKEQKKQLKNKTDDKLINYNKTLNKFLFENKFWNKEDLISYLSEQYNTNFRKFIDIKIFNSDEENNIILEDFNLSNNLSLFSLRNIKNSNNKTILKLLIDDLKKRSYSFLPKNINNISKKIIKFNENLKQIKREYIKNKSPFIEIINFEDHLLHSKIDFKLELNLSRNNEEIILSRIFIYMNVPFVDELILKFNEFRDKENYDEIVNIIFNNFENINSKFKELFLKYSSTKKEFLIIKKYIEYKINIKYSLDKINLMIKNNINFIDDINFIENDMYDLMIRSRFIDYYKFVNHFYPRLILRMLESKKVSLLTEIYLKDSKILSDYDYKWISNFINDKKRIYNQLNDKAVSFISERGWSDDLNSKIKKYNKNKDDEVLDENILNDAKFWRNAINFFAHFSQKPSKSDEKNQKKVFDRYSKLEDIKKKFLNIEKNNYNTYNISLSDLNYLDQIKEDLNKFKIKENKYFSKKQKI